MFVLDGAVVVDPPQAAMTRQTPAELSTPSAWRRVTLHFLVPAARDLAALHQKRSPEDRAPRERPDAVGAELSRVELSLLELLRLRVLGSPAGPIALHAFGHSLARRRTPGSIGLTTASCGLWFGRLCRGRYPGGSGTFSEIREHGINRIKLGIQFFQTRDSARPGQA